MTIKHRTATLKIMHNAAGKIVNTCGTVVECTNCSTGTTRGAYLVTFGGTIVNGSCSSCASLLTTYLLTQNAVNPCQYVYNGSTDCGTIQIEMTLNASSIVLTVFLSAVDEMTWTIGATAPYDCGLSRDFGTAPDGVVSGCDWSNVNPTATAA